MTTYPATTNIDLTVGKATTKSGWGGSTTYVYWGQIYLDGSTYRFGENIDDAVWLKIGKGESATVVLNNATHNVVSYGNLVLNGEGTPWYTEAGWYDFEVRLHNGSGGAGPVAGSGFTSTKGFGYVKGATDEVATLTSADWIVPADPNNASLLRYDDGVVVDKALEISANLPASITDADPDAFATRDALTPGTVFLPVPDEIYLEADEVSRYRRVGYALEFYDPEANELTPVAATLSEESKTLSFAYEEGGCYRLVWQYDFEYLVRCSSGGGLGTVSPAEETWVKQGDSIKVSTTLDNPEYEFLHWKDDSGNKYAGATATLSVTKSMELTPVFWRIGQSLVWYVKPANEGGDDANDGFAPETAKATIKAALADVPGHLASKIYLLAGTYHETNIVVSDPVQILGQTGNPDDVVIEYNFGDHWASKYRTFQVLHEDAVIANLTCDKAFGGESGQAITVELGKGGTLSNCVIRASSFAHPYRNGSVWVKHAKARVTRCLFVENKVDSDRGEQSWFWACGSAIYQTAGLVDNCVFIRNTAAKVTTYPWTSTVVMKSGTLANCSFFENTGSKAGALNIGEASARVYNTVFYGNSIVADSKVPDYPYHDSYAGVEKNFVHCAADEETMLGEGGIANLTAAAFKDYANGKYVPAFGGVLCNAGTTNGVPASALVLDFAGKPRVQGSKIDIGAYEAPPGGLRILIR